jgi:hypothetical protein
MVIYIMYTTVLKVDGKPIDVVKTRTAFVNTICRWKGMLNDRVIQIKGYAERTSNEWPAVGFLCLPGK